MDGYGWTAGAASGDATPRPSRVTPVRRGSRLIIERSEEAAVRLGFEVLQNG